MKQLIPLALAALLFPACVTDGSATPAGTRTSSYGSVITGGLDVVWATTRSTLTRLGSSAQFDEADYRAEADVQGARVTIECEPYNAERTILRIGAKRDGQEVPDVAESVQLAIQRALMR